MEAPSPQLIASLSNAENRQQAAANWQLILDELKANNAASPASACGAAATILIETAHTFMPIEEFGTAEYFHKMYGHRLDYQVDDTLKWKWRGRGFAQLTGLDNYRAAGYDLKIPLVDHPELACQTGIAVKIFRWFWVRCRLPALCDLVAQQPGYERWQRVRQVYNGGLNGIAEFDTALEQLGAI